MVSTAGGIVIAIIVLALAACVGWVVFTQLRARRLGLPPPSLSSYLPWKHSSDSYGPPRPAPGGVVGWFNDQLRKFKNRNNRSAAGAYETPLQGGGAPSSAGRRGFGPLDPDEAWDSRVGTEADGYGPYDEHELRNTEYGGGSYTMNVPEDNPYEGSRGRTGGQSGPAQLGSRNPFDDDAAASMRGVSPRPLDTGVGGKSGGGGGRDDGGDSAGSSPAERRSVFRENV